MQITVGRIGSNGKMFSVAGKKDSCSQLSLSSRRRFARSYEHNRSVPISYSTPLRQNLCSAKITSHITPIADIAAWIWKDPARYVGKYETLHEAKSQAIKITKFCRINLKRFEAIMVIQAIFLNHKHNEA